MRPFPKVVALAGIVALAIAWSIGRVGIAGAQEEPAVARSARGGLIAKTARNQFEVFFYPTGLRIFPLDSAGAPIVASKLAGMATFYHPNSPKPWFTRPLQAAAADAGQPSASLDLVIGLGTVPPTGAKVAFEVAGLPDPAGPTATFTVPVEFAAAPTASTPAAPPSGAAVGPRYVYGPGYYGFGYYQYPGPRAAPAAASSPTVYSYSTPSRRGSGGGTGSTHDWSTGRDYPSGGLISKPWLRPMD